MYTKNLAISTIGAAFLAGVLLVPAQASAHGGRDWDHDRYDRREHVERHHHHHRHDHGPKVVYEYRTVRPRWAREAPVVVYRDAPAVRLGRDNEIGITYRSGW